MSIEIHVPEYKDQVGLVYEWEDGFIISTNVVDSRITISANKAGLISLARQLLFLAQDDVPSYRSFIYDEFAALESGSTELLIEKNNNLTY